MKFLAFIKEALTGYDGKASHQKILIFYMTLLFTFVVLSVGFAGHEYPESVYHIIAGVIIGQSAIRAWQVTKDHKIEKEKYESNS